MPQRPAVTRARCHRPAPGSAGIGGPPPESPHEGRAHPGADDAAGDRDDDPACDRWEALLAGRWSIVETSSRAGQLRVVALENASTVGGSRGLTRRERAVVEAVVRGHSNKRVALELGLGESRLSTLLTGALRKLGVARREHLPRLAAALRARGAGQGRSP